MAKRKATTGNWGKDQKRRKPGPPEKKPASDAGTKEESGTRLNKYLAHSGVASRRKADELIKEGKISVNGKVVLEMGFKVMPSDKVEFKGKRISPERKAYVLLNKPKGFVTTTSDERDRKTVMELVKQAASERIYPVGRLDRNTTGLLLLTNDGELAQRLSHPSLEVEKVYMATLDKPLDNTHFKKIAQGIELEDGPSNRTAWPGRI